MTNQIVEKLRVLLSGSVDSECKVVYLLAESRKLLDANPPDPIPLALKMYCHWALHVELTNPGTTEQLLSRVDQFVDRIIAENEHIVEDHYLFQELVWLESFRQQFRDFLAGYNLPTKICDDDGCWHEFLTHYAGVIEDGSLTCQSKTRRLKHVSQIVFSKGRVQADCFVPFGLVWTISMHDGRSVVAEVYSKPLPNGAPMVVHGIRLQNWSITAST